MSASSGRLTIDEQVSAELVTTCCLPSGTALAFSLFEM